MAAAVIDIESETKKFQGVKIESGLILDYEEKYKNEDGIICYVCLHLICDPFESDPCGHILCANCFGSANKKTCGLCQQPIEGYHRNNKLRRSNLLIKVNCPNKGIGCAESMSLKDVPEHKNVCKFEKIFCESDCKESFLRSAYEEHKKVCLRRKVDCLECKATVTLNSMDDHKKNKCTERLVPCPNTCKNDLKIKFKEISEHLNVCTNNIIQCPHFDICGVKLKKSEMKEHENEYLVHLGIARGIIADLKDRMKHMASGLYGDSTGSESSPSKKSPNKGDVNPDEVVGIDISKFKVGEKYDIYDSDPRNRKWEPAIVLETNAFKGIKFRYTNFSDSRYDEWISNGNRIAPAGSKYSGTFTVKVGDPVDAYDKPYERWERAKIIEIDSANKKAKVKFDRYPQDSYDAVIEFNSGHMLKPGTKTGNGASSSSGIDFQISLNLDVYNSGVWEQAQVTEIDPEKRTATVQFHSRPGADHAVTFSLDDKQKVAQWKTKASK